VIIYGAGGHGKTLADLIKSLGCYCLVGFVDDTLPVGQTVMGLPILGATNILPELFNQGIHLAVNGIGGIGNPGIRLNAFQTLAEFGFTCPAVVHPSAWVEASAVIESGVQILAQTYVSSEVFIDQGTVLNASVVVSHDCRLGKCVNLSPGAMLAGGVKIGDMTQVGMAATINMNINIGQGVRIGNGATVKADVPDGMRIYAGAVWPPLTGSTNPGDHPSQKAE
jgi:sugar O-acyltransferase (sialic acid O-acetyltransferase NeuD family)